MSRSQVVCVLGMHRSGTSAVARILNLMGWSLGPAEKLMPAAEFNPAGHWEYQPFVDVNDEILATFGGSWDRPPHWPDGWHLSAALDPFRDRVRRLLETDFPPGLAWAWKDPRTCLTLPFWQDLLPSMKYAVCLRNPLDVALSLQQRDGFSLVKGGDLWLTYVASALLHTSALPRIFLYYEHLMRDWKPEVRRLAALLGDPRIPEGQETESSIEEFVDRSLEHYRSLPEQALSEGAIPYPARALYAMLESQSAGQREETERAREEAQKAEGPLDQFVEMALQAHRGVDQHRQIEESEHQAETLRANLAESLRQLAGLQANLTESQGQAADLAANLTESQRQAAMLHAKLAESQGQAGTLRANLAESHAQADTVRASLAESQAQAETLRGNLAERDLALAEMEHSLTALRQSRSWRLTRPLRWLGGRLRSLIDQR